MIQVTVDRVLTGLGLSFHSIDVRAATVRRAGLTKAVLAGVRISSKSVNDVQRRYRELEGAFGGRRTEAFGILWEALPFNHIDRISKELVGGRLVVEGEDISLPNAVSLGGLQGWIDRHASGVVAPSGTEAPSSLFCFFGATSLEYQSPELDDAVRRDLGFGSFEEMVDVFLETRKAGQRALDFFVWVDMPARLASVEIEGKKIRVNVEAEKNLPGLRLYLSRLAPDGMSLLEKRELSLTTDYEDEGLKVLKAQSELSTSSDDEHVTCVLAQQSISEVDSVRGRVKEFRKLMERNPLLVCLSAFWDMDKLFQQLERPYETKAGSRRFEPQDALQEAVATILTLGGFQSINLGREDKMRDPSTRVERGTADLLAYHDTGKMLLIGACTMSVAKTEDYDRLLHATEILRRLFPTGSRVSLVPVVFSGQESDPIGIDQAAERHLRVLTRHDLASLRQIVVEGREELFSAFLKGLTTLS